MLRYCAAINASVSGISDSFSFVKTSEKSVPKDHYGVLLLAILSSRATFEAVLEDRHLDLVS